MQANLLQSMKLSSRQKAERMSWEAASDKYIKYYDKICAE